MRRPVEPVAKSVCFLKFFRISLPIPLILFSCDHEPLESNSFNNYSDIHFLQGKGTIYSQLRKYNAIE